MVYDKMINSIKARNAPCPFWNMHDGMGMECVDWRLAPIIKAQRGRFMKTRVVIDGVVAGIGGSIATASRRFVLQQRLRFESRLKSCALLCRTEQRIRHCFRIHTGRGARRERGNIRKLQIATAAISFYAAGAIKNAGGHRRGFAARP